METVEKYGKDAIKITRTDEQIISVIDLQNELSVIDTQLLELNTIKKELENKIKIVEAK